MPDVNSLLRAIEPGFFQQAFIVADVASAQRACVVLGCDVFVDVPATDLEYNLRGETVSAALALAFGRSGNVQIELIQPVRGKSLHAEFLASKGPGVHHRGFLVDDLDEATSNGATLGFPAVMRGDFGNLRFCYLDTWEPLGIYTELVEDPDGMLMSVMPWR